MIASLEGPCGLIFVTDEPIDASKVLYNFAKDHEQLKLQAGRLEDKILETKDIESLAKLPDKLTLRTQAVIALKSPITSMVMVLHQRCRNYLFRPG
jgi:large subunit ribosomal protein L10